MTPKTETTILERMFESNSIAMPSETARYLVRLDFPPSDIARMNELAEKCRQGTLDQSEQDESEEYRRVADLLTFLQSKARRSLNNRG